MRNKDNLGPFVSLSKHLFVFSPTKRPRDITDLGIVVILVAVGETRDTTIPRSLSRKGNRESRKVSPL